MATCTAGHTSTALDYCDVCGEPLGAAPPAPAETSTCPACAAPVSGRFCESCGHDSALPTPVESTPVSPAPQPAAIASWTVVITADPEFYRRVVARDGPDTVEFPQFYPQRRITLEPGTSLIGRHNRDQGVDPDVDLGLQPADRGVSTQHAILRASVDTLTITDIGSTNGTSINGSEDRLPEGQETALADGDRIHIGAWTTLTVQRQ